MTHTETNIKVFAAVVFIIDNILHLKIPVVKNFLIFECKTIDIEIYQRLSIKKRKHPQKVLRKYPW